MVWTARHTHCRPMSKNMIFHHQCSLARQSLHLWPLVQSRLQHSLPRLLSCSFMRSEGFSIELFSAYGTIPQTLVLLLHKCKQSFFLRRERELASPSHWAPLRSLTIMNINVVNLSLNGKNFSWLLCVAYHLSRVSCAFGSRASTLLLCRSTFS